MMIEKPWSIIFALAVMVACGPARGFAQDDERRGFIGVGIGPSAPFGIFADPSQVDTRAGRATPGYTSTMLNVGYRIGREFGVAGAFSYSEYVMRDGGDDDWWQVAGLTAGPMYSRRINNKTAVDVKAMLGLIVLTPVVDSYADLVVSGLGVDMRAALRYDVFRRVALFAEAGVQSSNGSSAAGVRNDYRAMISGFGVAYRPKW
jgi:hypothetical protein